MAKKKNKNNIPKQVPFAIPIQDNVSEKKYQVPGKGFSNNVKLAFLLGLLSFAVYANTLNNGFAFDDFNVIKNNSIVTRGISAIPEIFATPYRKGWFLTNDLHNYVSLSNDTYRPLSLSMFATEYQLFNGSPVAGHFFNILFFSGCVILLFFFLDDLFEQKKTTVAVIASLLFALHPIHTEVVANIKSRDEIMCFFFAFLTLNLFLKYMQTGKIKQLIFGCLCFLLSLLSKETVITFLAIIPLIFFFYRNENKKYSLNITIGTIVMAGVFLTIRYSILRAYHVNNSSDVSFIDNMLSHPPSAISGFATKILILGFYLKLLIVPYPLICDYSYNSIPFVTFSNSWALLSMAVYIFLACLGIFRWVKNHKDPFAFAIIFYLVTLSLFSNLFFIIGSNMGERFIFFTSVGFCLAVALAIEKWILRSDNAGIASLKNPILLAILISVSIVYAGITINRNQDWFDNYTLFKADFDKRPNDWRLNYILGLEMTTTQLDKEKKTEAQKKIMEDGVALFNKALSIYPDFLKPHMELCRLYDRMQMYDSGIVHAKKVFEVDSAFTHVNDNLGILYLHIEKYQEAIEYFKRSIRLEPGIKKTYLNLARCYYKLKQYDSAIINFNKTILGDPKNIDAYLEIGRAFLMMNNFDSAIISFNKILLIDPKNVDAYLEIGQAYYNKNKVDSAVYYYKQVLALNPNDANTANNLGAISLNAKKYADAIGYLKTAISLNPNFMLAYTNISHAYFASGQYQLAIEAAMKEISLDKNQRDLPIMAWSYQKLGNMNEARKYEALTKQYYNNFKLQ